MAFALYPLGISPCTVGQNYVSEPIVPVGGVAPYVWAVTGTMPVGLTLSDTTEINSQATVVGRALVADQYTTNLQQQTPAIQNPSTFTITVTDSTPITPLVASVTYTQPVYLFSEAETISVYEMLRLSYQPQDPTLSNYYITMGNMGTVAIKIGEISAPLYGSITLIINAYLNNFTQGMRQRLREYLCVWDEIKLISQTQSAGAAGSITGLSNSWQVKRQLLLENVKSVLPAYTVAEYNARHNHQGGSDFTGSIAGADGGDGTLSVN